MFSQGNDWKVYCNGEVINSLDQDTVNIIVGTDGGGVIMINKTTLNPVYIKKGPNSITSNQVNYVMGSLYNDSKWACTDKGFSYFVPDSNKWLLFNHDNVPEIPLNRVTAAVGTNSDLFIVCNTYWNIFAPEWILGGIARLNTVHGWSNLWPGNSAFFNCIGITPNKDQLFVGGSFGNAPPSGGVSMYRFADSTWNHIYTGNSALPSDNINCMHFDAQSLAVDFGTNKGFAEHIGLDTLTGTDNWTIIDTSNSNLPDNNVTCITTEYTIDSVHQYWWIGTRFGGLMRVDTYDGTSIVYDTSNSDLGSNNITSICIEYANPEVVWIGTDNGLYRFDQTTFTKITTSEQPLPSNSVTDIAFDNNNNKWIATNKGLAKFNSGWTIYNPQNSGLKYSAPYCLFAENNDLWIGANDNINGPLCKYDGNNWAYFLGTGTGYPFLHTITDITSDNAGNKWFGSDYGVFKFGNPYFSNWNATTGYPAALPSNYIKSIIADNNDSIWIATGNGLAKNGNFPWTVYNPGNSQIPSYEINAIIQDDSLYYWVATNNGLAKYDKQNNNWKLYDTNSANFGSMVVYDVAYEGDSLIWISSRKGISSLNRTTQQWTNYNTDNSDLTDDLVVEIKIDPLGNKWMCTWEGGLVEFKRNGIASGISKLFARNSEINIYPNPFSHSTTVEISDKRFANGDVTIYDMLGREVHHQTLYSRLEKINLDLPAGIYFYKIYNEKNETVGNGKLMIQ